jgi:RNA polymerase sigma-70 factor, ECF subfamily
MMDSAQIVETARLEGWADEEVVRRVRGGEAALYEIIMRRYNQRLYRVARAILRDDAEAEDVMQAAYVLAYEHLDQFEGRAPFSVWLTRIAVREALGRLRQRKRISSVEENEQAGEPFVNQFVESSPNPEQIASRGELGKLLQEALLELPEQYRTVVILRDVEELSTTETAAVLEISEENVKVRLHRGRSMARGWLFDRVGAGAKEALPFMGARCDRVVEGVFARLAERREI